MGYRFSLETAVANHGDKLNYKVIYDLLVLMYLRRIRKCHRYV